MRVREIAEEGDEMGRGHRPWETGGMAGRLELPRSEREEATTGVLSPSVISREWANQPTPQGEFERARRRGLDGRVGKVQWARDRKSWPRLGNWAVRGPSCNPPAGHCKRIRRVCFILHFTNTRQNKLPKWPPFRVKKVSPNRRNKGGWAPAPTVSGTGGGGAGRHE